jgi:hypothetical protein
MSQWNIKRSSVLILLGVFVVMLVIVIAPDWDLPDAAFHGGNAPVVVHTLATSAPAAATTIASLFNLPSCSKVSRDFHEHPAFAVYSAPNFLPIFHRSLRR